MGDGAEIQVAIGWSVSNPSSSIPNPPFLPQLSVKQNEPDVAVVVHLPMNSERQLMQPPILPIQHSDVQWASYASTGQLIATEPVPPKLNTPLLMNAAIVLFVITAFSAIIYKKQRSDRLHQSVRRLEKLWQLESHSPFEERF